MTDSHFLVTETSGAQVTRRFPARLVILSLLAGEGKALRDRSGGTFDLPEGTVYPALHRLERAGLVASAWNDDTGRRRRCYELTDQGSAALAANQSEWQALVRDVAAILAPAQGAPA
ncbi:PadR family transcriptional regulator [Micromonospora sp. IBHARD004]|uniref:PadR family transcriptional regulator n=1 Tax=Micromonospora sp. IBHARD004 TaxID=3457764 RepID=UPI00405806AE